MRLKTARTVFATIIDVADHRPVVDIRQIQTNSFIPRKIGSATDLPQAGNTRLNEQPSQYFAVVGFNFAPQRWTRTHDTHLMAEHIDELRQLIDTETPQYATYWCYPRVVSDLEEKTVTFIGVQQARQLLVGVCDHGAELQHRKRLAIDSDAFRGVEDWAPTADLDRDRGDEEDRQGHYEGRQCEAKVKSALLRTALHRDIAVSQHATAEARQLVASPTERARHP